jgi:anti-sigma factor RsiW
MNCREFAEFLHEYLSGTLPAVERAQFDRHLANCPTCISYLDSYQKTIQLAKTAFSGPGNAPLPVEVPEELIQAILRTRSRTS